MVDSSEDLIALFFFFLNQPVTVTSFNFSITNKNFILMWGVYIGVCIAYLGGGVLGWCMCTGFSGVFWGLFKVENH